MFSSLILLSIAMDYHAGIEQIKPWCDKVANNMGFHHAEEIVMRSTGIHFTAVTSGHCRTAFRFDYADLNDNPEDVALRKSYL